MNQQRKIAQFTNEDRFKQFCKTIRKNVIFLYNKDICVNKNTILDPVLLDILYMILTTCLPTVVGADNVIPKEIYTDNILFLLFICDLAQEINIETPEDITDFNNVKFLGGQLSQYYVFSRFCSERNISFDTLKSNINIKIDNGFKNDSNSKTFGKTINKLVTSIGNNNAKLNLIDFPEDIEQLINWNKFNVVGCSHEIFTTLYNHSLKHLNDRFILIERHNNDLIPKDIKDLLK